MKTTLFVLTIVILAMIVLAEQPVSDGTGGMGETGSVSGSMMMGPLDSTMSVVADDGSTLVVEHGMGMTRSHERFCSVEVLLTSTKTGSGSGE
jgi:hypothetical protein